MYDVIVAGSGPAGAGAACFLSQAGMNVLVLEKERLPRYKACGGGVSLKMLEKYFPFSFEAVIERRVDRIAYALGSRYQEMPLPPDSLAMVMRERFDAFLLEKSGAEVAEKTAVERVSQSTDWVEVETAGGKKYQARYLIGADGANSVVAREAGLRRGKVLAAAIEVEASVPADVYHRFESAPLFIFGELRKGYLWVFPKSDHLSVGLATLKPRSGELQSTLKRVMDRYGIRLDGASQHGHGLPFHMSNEPVSTRRILLTGDAAGLVDPLSGEGIRLAIKSSRMAADAILADRPQDYQAMIERTIGRDNFLALYLGKVFYRFPRACYALGVRNPLASLAVLDLLSDNIGYPGLLLRLFGTIPYPLLQPALRAAGLDNKVTD